MAYFGGSGVVGDLHPSLRIYIACFHSSPMPKMYPRGGGYADQDPLLMRDFREIRKLELQCKEQNEGPDGSEGGVGGLKGSLDDYIQQLEEDGEF